MRPRDARGEHGSNMRPSDLQSDALPTKLSPLIKHHWPETKTRPWYGRGVPTNKNEQIDCAKLISTYG